MEDVLIALLVASLILTIFLLMTVRALSDVINSYQRTEGILIASRDKMEALNLELVREYGTMMQNLQDPIIARLKAQSSKDKASVERDRAQIEWIKQRASSDQVDAKKVLDKLEQAAQGHQQKVEKSNQIPIGSSRTLMVQDGMTTTTRGE